VRSMRAPINKWGVFGIFTQFVMMTSSTSSSSSSSSSALVDDTLKQRRGKKSVASTISAPTPLEQMRSAQAKLFVSRDRTADLHAAWRSQLFRFSLLVVFVTMYQLQASLSACIREIKNQKGATVSGIGAIKILLGDSYCELMGVFISSSLSYFLALGYHTGLELETWPYVLSTALTPICVGLFFNSRPVGCSGGEELDMTGDDKRHQFPAVILWHTIVTGAYWFMKSGKEECDLNVLICTQAIEDLEKTNEQITTTAKAKIKKKST
jgi:hypothetical protein